MCNIFAFRLQNYRFFLTFANFFVEKVTADSIFFGESLSKVANKAGKTTKQILQPIKTDMPETKFANGQDGHAMVRVGA